jgi:hypothetical protein
MLLGLLFLAVSFGGFAAASYWLRVAFIKFRRSGGQRKIRWRDFFRSTPVWDQSWKNLAIESVTLFLLSLIALLFGLLVLRAPDPTKQKQAAELRGP